MPTESTQDLRKVSYPGAGTKNVQFHLKQRSWQHSPRVNGKLRLQSNPYYKDIRTFRKWDYSGSEFPGALNAMPVAVSTPVSQAATKAAYAAGMQALEAESYAKLRGKLYKGSASLGVTIASYKEAREMVVKNYRLWNDLSQTALHRQRWNRRNAAFTTSDNYLEYIFGIKPIYEDILKTTTGLIKHAFPPEFVSVRTSKVTPIPFVKTYDNGLQRQFYTGNLIMRVNRSTTVRISNPNLWLAERAGVLNIGTIAWDLVPWSFLLNMFVNLNQLVQSVSDFVGLEFPNGSMTRRSIFSLSGLHQFRHQGEWMHAGRTLEFSDNQSRARGAVQRPPLIMKVPSANWETAAMAASLCTQQLNRLRWIRNFRNFKN